MKFLIEPTYKERLFIKRVFSELEDHELLNGIITTCKDDYYAIQQLRVKNLMEDKGRVRCDLHRVYGFKKKYFKFLKDYASKMK